MNDHGSHVDGEDNVGNSARNTFPIELEDDTEEEEMEFSGAG
jgi:hypothetical protein